MTGTIDNKANNLLILLDEQIKRYEKLLKLNLKQASCLVRGDQSEISSYAQQAEELMGQILKISKSADKAVAGIAVSLGMSKQSRYIEVVSKLNGFGDRINSKLRTIANLISELAPANYKNALLIKQGSEIENFKLNAIKNKVSTENIYSINGKLNKKDGFLLDKQV